MTGPAGAPGSLRLDEVVAHWAATTPDRPALEYPSGRRTTYAELEDAARRVAERVDQALLDDGVAAVVCDDGPDFHAVVNGLWRRNVSTLLVSRTWGRAVVADLLALTGCRVLVVPDGAEGTVDAERTLEYSQLTSGDAPPVGAAGLEAGLDSVAILATTSGTTDDPRCVPITHRQIRSAYRSCLAVHDFTPVRKAASLFPLNGIGVMGVCYLLPREVGASTLTLPTFSMATIRSSWEAVIKHDVDFVYVVPAVVRLLAALPALRADHTVLVFCAAAPVHRRELRALEDRFPVRVFNVYGLTELTFAVFFGCRDDDGGASDSIGPAAGVEARIVGDDGTVHDGPAVGELHLSGPMATGSYLENPTATERAWDRGWLRTGDLAERDDRSHYFIRGRLSDTVLRGGILQYLHELEHYVRRAPGVVDVCAFKGREVPSGDELCVLIQGERDALRADMRGWIAEHLGTEKVPNTIIVRDEPLPINLNGKVSRAAIAQMYLAGELDGADGSR